MCWLRAAQPCRQTCREHTASPLGRPGHQLTSTAASDAAAYEGHDRVTRVLHDTRIQSTMPCFVRQNAPPVLYLSLQQVAQGRGWSVLSLTHALLLLLQEGQRSRIC